ncbi:MAG TPA: tetratricopeptide repeat protein, partial [Myxococcales bacterium]|nr:tetratricopeptide repeat protein [Myxococcales bacterium]
MKLALFLLLALGAADRDEKLIAQLKADIGRTERAIALTEVQIARSRAATYLPELQFRLAELYVEKSRYTYLLQQQESGVTKGSQVVPEVRLTKLKALQIYDRILRESPDWPGCDRVRFYMAHEYRELGDFQKMIDTEEELAAKHPNSPLAAEALLIVGDHWFGAQDLAKAEEAYQRVLAGPPSPPRDLANFKMGWVRFNQGKHADAVKYFEQAAASPLLDTASHEVLDVKREALYDLVFSYTEARPWKGAVEYFEKLAQGHAVYLGVLDKLANRYFIKQEAEPAVLAYRKLLQLSRDSERDAEYAQRLHDAVKAGKDKTPPHAEDVSAIVRAAARVQIDERLQPAAQKQTVADLEVYARDLATELLVQAKQKQDKALLSQAADAHAAWLSLFAAGPQGPAMRKNRAEALFAAERWAEAGRAWELVAKDAAAAKQTAAEDDALFNALAAHFKAGRDNAPVSAWRRTDSLRAMSLLGAAYVSKFPRSPRVAQVKFNVARAAYDEGDWKRAAELFAAYVEDHPQTSDTAAAANLALDSLHSAGDYDGLDKLGKQLTANPKLPADLRKDLAQVVTRARGEQLSMVALESTARSGDAARGLVELAEKQPHTELAERALHAAFVTYREKHDVQKLTEVGQKFLTAYPNSPLALDVLSTAARVQLDVADFDSAAQAWEMMEQKYPNEPSGIEAASAAASIRQLLGDPRRAVADLERLQPERRGGTVALRLAQARWEAGDAAGAESAAGQLMRADATDGDAAAIYGRALLAQGKTAEAARQIAASVRAVRKGRAQPLAVATLWDLLGEAQLKLLLAMPADPIDPQVTALKSLQEASEAVAQLRFPELALHALYRLAQGLDRVAQTLAATQPPPKLTASDQQQFLAQVAAQSQQLRAQAQAAYQGCAAKAKELDLFAPWVQGCAQGRPVADGTEAPRPPSPTQPVLSAAVQEARGPLAGNPNAEGLEKLASAQMSAGDLVRARLTLRRALELDEASPTVHAALG